MKSPIESLLGQTIRKKRMQLKLSQEDFADLAGIHRTYITKIENGKVSVTIGMANLIAGTLQIPLSKLLRDAEKS